MVGRGELARFVVLGGSGMVLGLIESMGKTSEAVASEAVVVAAANW